MYQGQEVVVIPAKKVEFFSAATGTGVKKRVAAYARVSTSTEEQEGSYEAQISYYTKYITEKPEWVLVDIYTDEGISGTSTKNREGFKRMIADALAGKIDMIITKSCSRFARNTVTTLSTIRELKDKGVDVYFEKENIHSTDSKGELLLTIMSSLAQDESRNISENVKWGHRQRFSEGKVYLHYKNFLGYEKGPNGRPQIVEKEAKIIRLIYDMYLKGCTTGYIARYLTQAGYKTATGKDKWGDAVIKSILSNEKYYGACLSQKTYVADFLTKKKMKNRGELQQYYVEKSHPAIVSKEIFDLAQEKIAHTKGNINYVNFLSGKLYCAECGSAFGIKVWHSNDKYRRIIWRCNEKYGKKAEKCHTPHITEEDVKKSFIALLNKLFVNRKEIIEAGQLALEVMRNTEKLDKAIAEQKERIKRCEEGLELLIDHAAKGKIAGDEYEAELKTRQKEYEQLIEEQKRLEADKASKKDRVIRLQAYLDSMGKIPPIAIEFDEEIWAALVDKVYVQEDGSLEYLLYDGEKYR